MENFKFTLDPQNQISQFLMDNLKPLTIPDHGDTQFKTDCYIKPYLKAIDLILELGEAEHTSDWDPSVLVILKSGHKIETEPGYYIMEIQNDDILLEDELGAGDQDDGDQSYHIISINDIHSIELIRN